MRDNRTGAYLAGEGAWVGDLDEAVEFGTLQAAGREARACDGEHVVVVLRYENPECELAVNPAFCV